MAKTKQTPNERAQIGGNIEGLKADLAAWRDEHIKAERERKAINDKLAEIRSKAEAVGITKKAFADALRYYKEDQEKRQGYDNAYILAREAFGLPINGAQLDLFKEEGTDANA